jgi:D-xylose transport system ATP-binding protein
MSEHDRAATTAAPVLEVRGARKSFGAVNALNGVSLELREREVLALLGDNGAGKSTLIKAITGTIALDEGDVLLRGESLRGRTPAQVRDAGIETVFQDLAVFDNLSAKANLFIAREPTSPRWLGPLGFLSERKMNKLWDQHVNDLEVNIPRSRESIAVMSGGQRQAIAVARAAAFASSIVLLDEPTAALGLRESRQTLDLIRRLPERGVSVILISHNLDHVRQVADRAVVLRRGQLVGEAVPSAENDERLVSLIVGAIDGVTGAEGR